MTQAKKKAINSMKYTIRDKYKDLPYDDLFNPEKCEVYFSFLGDVIDKNWNAFMHLFKTNKGTVKSYFVLLNDLRRECHAKDVSDNEMQTFRGAIGFLEKMIKEYYGE